MRGRKKTKPAKPLPWAFCNDQTPHEPHDWTASAFGVGDSIRCRCPGTNEQADEAVDQLAEDAAMLVPEPPVTWAAAAKACADTARILVERQRPAGMEDNGACSLCKGEGCPLCDSSRWSHILDDSEQPEPADPAADPRRHAAYLAGEHCGAVCASCDRRMTCSLADRHADESLDRAREAERHYHALADRYRRALEQLADLNARATSVNGMSSTRIAREALDADPRPGEPTDRYHWGHMKDGDKLIWRLVAELVELRDAQAVVVGAPTLKHHPAPDPAQRARWQPAIARNGRLRVALADLHRAHARSKKAERSMGRTIGRLQAALRSAVMRSEAAEAACERLARDGRGHGETGKGY